MRDDICSPQPENNNPQPKEGGMIDVGRVILPDDTHHMVLAEIIYVPPLPKAIEALAKSVRKFGAEELRIVSRVRGDRKNLLRAWLKEQKIFELTGLINDDDDEPWKPGCRKHVIWCDHFYEKGLIVHDLGSTFVVDDQPEVHNSIIKSHTSLQLADNDRRLRQYGFRYTVQDREVHEDQPTRVKLIDSWEEFMLCEGLEKY